MNLLSYNQNTVNIGTAKSRDIHKSANSRTLKQQIGNILVVILLTSVGFQRDLKNLNVTRKLPGGVLVSTCPGICSTQKIAVFRGPSANTSTI